MNKKFNIDKVIQYLSILILDYKHKSKMEFLDQNDLLIIDLFNNYVYTYDEIKSYISKTYNINLENYLEDITPIESLHDKLITIEKRKKRINNFICEN